MNYEKVKEIAKLSGNCASNMSRFNKLESAKSFSKRTKKMSMIMKVEDEYWVVYPAEAHSLNKLGYEYVK